MTIDELFEHQAEELARQQSLDNRIYCCTAAGCTSSGAEAVKKAIGEEIKKQDLGGKLEVCGTGCMGLCSRGPLLKMSAGQTMYAGVEPGDAEAVVKAACARDGAPDDGAAGRLAGLRLEAGIPFFARQTKVVLANAGVVDPERLADYIAAGGYQALARCLSEMSPQEIVEEIKASGLRGRGGAGYPTGLKWELVARQESPIKYVVCNADEGDPGAFMDRSVLEGDPHRVLEGMAIAGQAVGAQQGYIYVRGEYGLAIQRLQNAIKQAEREHLLGGRIFDSGFQFRIDIRIGAGAFVCGEETALIASIEGRRGQPRQRPPLPARIGAVGPADANQQRRDVRQRHRHHQQGQPVVRLHRHRQKQGHQGLRAGRKNHQHRPD